MEEKKRKSKYDTIAEKLDIIRAKKRNAGALRKYAGGIFLERIALRRATIKRKPIGFSTKE